MRKFFFFCFGLNIVSRGSVHFLMLVRIFVLLRVKKYVRDRIIHLDKSIQNNIFSCYSLIYEPTDQIYG
jgi:hypothetical protein